MKKKIYCLFFAAVMLFACLASCSDQPGQPADITDTAAVSAENTVPETESIYDENGYLKDELGNFDYGGRDYTIFFWENSPLPEFFGEELSGAAISDANYNRNCRVEERCGIQLQYITTPGDSPNRNAFVQKLQAVLTSGSDDIDLIGAYSMATGICVSDGLCMDMSSSGNLEWDKPWWPEARIDLLKIKNKLYFVSGDISVNTLVAMYATFFNKALLEDRKLDDPYTLVENNTWTLDKMYEICKGVYDDTNKNGIVDFGDTFGTIFEYELIDAYVNAAGLTFLRSVDGEMEMNPDMFGEIGINTFDKIIGISRDSSATYLYNKSGATGSEGRREFSNGLLLFWTDTVSEAGPIVESTVDYGIVPVPKVNTDQENFATPMDFTYTMFMLPYDTEDEDYATSVMEIIASESYRTTTPVIYDSTLKYRYANDVKASEMFDRMREEMMFDPVQMFSQTFNHPYNTLRKTIIDGSSWKTMSKAYEKTWQKNLQTLMEAFD